MPLTEAAAQLLRTVLVERDALVDRVTDQVFHGSADLAGKRPLAVTRILVTRVFSFSEAVLLRGDESELDQFIDQVTGIRAEPDYHVSTLLSGFRSFRSGIEERACSLAQDKAIACELLIAVDDLVARSSARAADLLVERQQAALLSRRGQVERENAKLAAELQAAQEAVSSLRAELDEAALLTMRLEHDLREHDAIIEVLAVADPQAREIVARYPAGAERLKALRAHCRKKQPSDPGAAGGSSTRSGSGGAEPAEGGAGRLEPGDRGSTAARSRGAIAGELHPAGSGGPKPAEGQGRGR